MQFKFDPNQDFQIRAIERRYRPARRPDAGAGRGPVQNRDA